MMNPGKDYFHERDFTPCPKPGRRLGKDRMPPKKAKMSHKALSGLGTPRRKDGCKLGARRRLALEQWYQARLMYITKRADEDSNIEGWAK